MVVCDIRMPGMDGLTLLDKARSIDRDLPVILITGHGDISMAVNAIRDGAYDFIEKPYAPDRLVETVRRAMDKRSLTLENRNLKTELRPRASLVPASSDGPRPCNEYAPPSLRFPIPMPMSCCWARPVPARSWLPAPA